MTQLPYNEKDINSIFEYSKHLINKCLRDFTPDAKEKAGKGGVGQLVEKLYFKYDINNRPESDFAFVNAELKCTPLKKSKDNDLQIKERLVCSMINYSEDWNKAFEESNFYKKCLVMLILFYLHTANVSRLDLIFLFSVLWKIPQKDLAIIQHDYDTIINKICEGKAHTLSEGDTMYLGACRKGAKGDSLMKQHNSDIGAPRRAWSLKPSYMRIVLDEVKKYNEGGAYCNFELPKETYETIFSLKELENDTVDNILRNRFKPFIGLSYHEICSKLELDLSNSKSKYFLISNAIAGKGLVSNVNRCEEFLKSGLTLKTIRITRSGRIKECMSFENIDYQEIYDCSEWTDSRLYELFTSRFLFVVFRETNNDIELSPAKTEREYKLEKVVLWTMSQEDLTIAQDYWNNIRQNVCNNHIEPKYFWSINDKKNFHVRPKATKSSQLTKNPNGGTAKKYCYWFNAEYVKHIIEHEE